MLDRQNEELSKVEQKLKQLAKQNGLSSIRYTIVMLLMELNEIKRNKTMLNEISLLHWQESPKELQRQIASESVEHKKSDIFNIKRVKHEKSMDITSDMIVKTMKQTDENPYSFSDDKRDQLIQLIKSLSDEKICFEQDSALEFLINYFHRQTSESIQSIIEILKSLMAMFILLDSTSLAEICKDLLQFCEKHAHDQTDRFHLPAPKLEQFRTKTLENAITQRSAHLQTLNPYDKTNLMLITSDDQDIQAYKLIHIYPHFVRLYKRHETLTRILRDQSNYNKSMGIQLSYLRLSDCIALLFPELPMLFMGSLQLYAISDAVVHQYDQDLQQCKAQKANIEKELTKLASDHNRREQLETVKTDADNAYIRSEQDYHSNLNKEALKQIRQLMEINRQLQVKCNHLATQIIEKIENKQQTKNDLQETQRLITSNIVLPIVGVPQISSITMTVDTLYHNTKELSRVAFQIDKFADDARVIYSSKVLSILLYHCSSLYARITIFLVQLFKTQQTNQLTLAQLKTMKLDIGNDSCEWDDCMKRLLILSGFRECIHLPGTSLPVDEYSLKEVHKNLIYDFSLLRHSLQLRYTHIFGDICYNPVAIINDLERKMKELIEIDDWKNSGRIVKSTLKTNLLVQVSYNLNVLVNSTQYLMTKILENMTDKLELETLNSIEPFLTNLKVSIHLSCSSSLDTMHTEFLEYIYKDQLDLLLDHGLMVIECLYNERKKLVEPLSHIQSVLENFVDHFALFLIQLSQQYQQKQVDSLQNQYNSTMKARLNFDDIHLLEALSKTNLIRHFHHIENIDKNLDWYNHLTQFLVQGSSQASCILRSFAAPTTTNPNSNSKRLRYSFVFKLLNDEGQQILVFLQQTIGQLRAKYPEIEMLNDEPVIVYLIHLTKLLRYELLQMSTMNLKALKCNLNNIDRLTPRPNAQEIKSISDEWNKEINLLLAHRKKINEELINQKIENYHDRVRTIEEENKHLKIDYDLKCKQAHGRIEYIKKLSIDIVNNVKLIGQLLHEAKYRSNNFDIENSDTLLNDTVQIVRELLRVQQLIPKQCRLDDDKEGKYLKNMTCLDSIRIEVKSVKYHDTLIYTNWSYIRLTEWDSRIQLISEGHDKERVEGFSKPLDYDLTSTSVSDLFQYSIPSPSDSSSTSSSTPWILILFAGTTQNNKWAEMTR
ncbi:unnamed protein product, partial [Didymodactylos carnosus]